MSGAIFCLLAICVARPVLGESLTPLQSETAWTVPKGRMELRVGASYFNDRRFPPFTPSDALQSQGLVTAPEIALQIAAGSWAEVQAGFEMIYLDETTTDGDDTTTYGNGDARLHTKVRVLREKGLRPGLGVRFGSKLPNASKESLRGTDETDFGIEVLGSKTVSDWQGHLNLGLLLLGNPGSIRGVDRSGDGQDDLFTYSVAVVSPSLRREGQGWRPRLLAEVIGWAGSRFDNDRASFRSGLQLDRAGAVLYAGMSVGLVSGSEDFGFSGGLLYSFDLTALIEAVD
jgi:hypothetical protein